MSNLPRHIHLRLVRADSGFCQAPWLSLLESQNLRYGRRWPMPASPLATTATRSSDGSLICSVSESNGRGVEKLTGVVALVQVQSLQTLLVHRRDLGSRSTRVYIRARWGGERPGIAAGAPATPGFEGDGASPPNIGLRAILVQSPSPRTGAPESDPVAMAGWLLQRGNWLMTAVQLHAGVPGNTAASELCEFQPLPPERPRGVAWMTAGSIMESSPQRDEVAGGCRVQAELRASLPARSSGTSGGGSRLEGRQFRAELRNQFIPAGAAIVAPCAEYALDRDGTERATPSNDWFVVFEPIPAGASSR